MKHKFLLLISMILCNIDYAMSQDSATDPLYLKDLDSHFDKNVTNAMQYWNIPGVVIGVIHKNVVVHAQGYGVSSIETQQPIDMDSIFPIASITKVFLATVVAQFVDQGLLSWDDTIIQHLPYFKVEDAYATHNLTIRDLLSHAAGFQRTDLVWFLSDYNSDQLIEQLKGLKLEKSFRSHAQYSNFGGIILAKILEAKSGLPWETLVQKYVFDPLNMQSTYPDNQGLAQEANISWCHAEIDGKLVQHERLNYDNIKPSIGINASVKDLLQFVSLNLNHGRYDGKTIISSDVIAEMHEAQVVMRKKQHPGWDGFFPKNSFDWAFGLGWTTCVYKGKKIVHFGGYTSGGLSTIVLIPELDLGFVVIANKYAPDFVNATKNIIIDRYCGDMTSDCYKLDRVPNTTPELSLPEYAGEYENDLYGNIKIYVHDEELIIDSATFKGRLTHWHYNTFHLIHASPYIGEKVLTTFNINSQGKVDCVLFEIQAYYAAKIYFTKLEI